MTKLDELVSFILSDKLKEIRNFDCYDELVAEAQKLQQKQVKNIAYEPVLAPVNYKQHYIEWRNKYFSKVDKVFEYKTKNKTEYFTTEQLHKKYEKAMLESPFNGC